jgi:hypothetical protein
MGVWCRLSLVALAAAGSFILTACLSNEDRATTTSRAPTKSLRAHGVHIEIPAGWDGRVDWPSRDYVRTVHLASFRLPSRIDGRGHAAERRMRPGDVYINMAIDSALQASAPLSKLEIRRSHLTSEWEGKVPEAAVRASRHALVDGRSIQIWVTFGSAPTDAVLWSVNRIVETLVVETAAATANT